MTSTVQEVMTEEEHAVRLMIDLSERAPQERDVSRAAWQRGIGAVLFNETSELLFAPGSVRFTAEDQVHTMPDLLERGTGDLAPDWWCKSGNALDAVLNQRLIGVRPASIGQRLHPDTQQALVRYTHNGQGGLPRILHEAVRAQVHVPMNVLGIVSMTAEMQQIPGYTPNDIAGAGQMLRRPDVREVVKQLLFARNGVTREISVQSGGHIRYNRTTRMRESKAYLGRFMAQCIEFNDDGFTLNPRFKALLRDSIREVNALGQNTTDTDVSERPSSGCPAGHLMPHAKDALSHPEELERLSVIFEKTKLELLAERRQTVVEDGLDFMATILENFDDYTSGKLTTYSGSAQYPARTGQPSAVHA